MTQRRVRDGLYCLLVAVLARMAACSRPAEAPIRRTTEGITLKRKPSLKGVDLLLLIDESGSIYGDRGTDPQGLRYKAGKYLVQNLLVKEAPAGAPHRIAIIHFGDIALFYSLAALIPANAEHLTQRLPHTGYIWGTPDRKRSRSLRPRRLPPGGQAEDRLFKDVAEPILNELLKQMHWSFAVDPKDPNRYKPLQVSSEVPGYDYQTYGGVLLSVYTQERLGKVHQYNPYQHVQYARNTLRRLLEQQTIWDVQWYDFEYEWKRRPEHAEKGVDDYVKDRLSWLLRSEPLLNYSVASNR